MARLIPIDGAQGEGGGQVLRTALALSAVTGQGFEITKIRERARVPACGPAPCGRARGLADLPGEGGRRYDGSPDMRFEPGAMTSGRFRLEIATAGAAPLVMQTVVAPLATTSESEFTVEVTGGTHVPSSPSYHYLARHWAAVVARLGLRAQFELVRAGFYPPGGDEIRAEVSPWPRPASLSLEHRGALVEIIGTSGAGKVKTDVVQRQAEAARARLWEARRLESRWDVVEMPSASPGSFLLLEAVFEDSRAAFGFLGERGLRAEILGDRAARTLLAFLDTDAATDPHLADQLAVPLAIAKGGGRVSTNVVPRTSRRWRPWSASSGSGRARGAAAAGRAGSRWTRVDPPEAFG